MSSKLRNLSISDIVLDRDNPRIKHFLEMYRPEKITAEAIALALSNSGNPGDSTTSFTSLRDSIKVTGGIIHPIIVSHEADGTYVVIEGNTRLHIYKEFHELDPSGRWAEIPAIVYEQLSDFKKHEIRLQSHLVGPREWEPYSKAKYLYQLSVVENMPLNQIISLCGGRKSEIQKSIDAYMFMESVYRPYVKTHKYSFNVKEFSKFLEFQNTGIKRSITSAGFSEEIFAEWVAESKVDKALKVRILPRVLAHPEAKNKFLHTNLTEAEKVLAASELETADLSRYPYHVLIHELRKKMATPDPSFEEMSRLAHSDSPDDLNRIYDIESLRDQLGLILNHIESLK